MMVLFQQIMQLGNLNLLIKSHLINHRFQKEHLEYDYSPEFTRTHSQTAKQILKRIEKCDSIHQQGV